MIDWITTIAPLFDATAPLSGPAAGLASWWIKGALILAAGALAARLLARRSAAARHLAWTLAVLAALALPLASGLLPRLAVELPEVAEPTAAAVAPSPATGAGETVPAPGELPAAPAGLRLADTESATASAGSLAATAVAPENAAPAPAVAARALSFLRTLPLAAAGLAIWLAGVLFLLLRAVVDRRHRRRIVRRATPWPAGASEDRELLAAAPRTLRPGRLRRLRLLRSPDAPVPMTWGVLRPVVVLPAAAAHWSEARRRHVVLHELAHVRRLDVLWQSLAELLCAVAWVDPLAWMARRALRREAELACDDAVLVAGVRPSHYAGHLLQAARDLRDRRRRARAAPLPRAAVAMARSPALGDRIAAILQADRRRQPVGARRALLAVLAALAVGLPLAALSPAAGAEPSPSPGPDDGRRVHRTHETDEPETGYFTAPRFAGQCDRGVFTGRTFGTRVNARDDEWQIEVFHGLCELEIGMAGDVELRPDGRGIARMGRGARMTIEEDAGVDRKLEVTADPNGVPQYRLTVDGEVRPIDDQARAWFRGVLVEVFRSTGLQAAERVDHLLSEGGVPAVLAEIEHVSSDHVAGVYFAETLARHRLTAREAASVLTLAGETLGSDHELAELMMAVDTGLLSEPAVRDAYVGAARSIGSDHDTGRVLHALLEDREIPPETLDELMVIAEDIGSDHESSEVLLALAGRYPAGQPLPATFYQVASGIGSDHDLSRVLIELIDRGRTDRATVEAVLRAAENIGSDHDLSRLLVRIAEEVPLDGDLRQQYLERAEDVGSDHDHDRVLAALGRQGR